MKMRLVIIVTFSWLALATIAKSENSDGTQPEETTLNIKSKFPFVDRTKFINRGTIQYSIPKKRNDGIKVGDARKSGDITKIIKLLNETEKQNQNFKIGKGEVSKKKKKDANGPKIRGCIDCVLIAKNGKLILEEYFADAHIDKPHDQMSITKSILCYAIGKAIEQGKIKSENDLILDYLPEVNRSKIAKGVDTLTLYDLLSMNSGIRYKAPAKKPKITLKNHAQLYLNHTKPITEKKEYKVRRHQLRPVVPHTLQHHREKSWRICRRAFVQTDGNN